MAESLAGALFAHPLVPTSHWEPRCGICRLAKDEPDAYEWVTKALLAGQLTQQEIADQLAERWHVEARQSQLSNHKVNHLDPDLADARETFIGMRVMLEFCGDMPAEQMAVVYAQVAMAKLGELLRGEKDPEVASKLGGTIASLSKALQSGVQLPGQLSAQALDNRTRELREAVARGDFQDAFATWVEQNYPTLPALLAAQKDAADDNG